MDSMSVACCVWCDTPPAGQKHRCFPIDDCELPRCGGGSKNHTAPLAKQSDACISECSATTRIAVVVFLSLVTVGVLGFCGYCVWDSWCSKKDRPYVVM